ncbi:MAG: lipid II flippase MurJ [Candidatus Limnocylindrales bacterium]
MDELTRRPGVSSGAEPPVVVGSRRADRPGKPQARSLRARVRAILETALPRGALILASVTFIGFVMGLLETKALAHQFGAGTDTDAFNAAFVLPQFVLEVLVVGGMIASFVPLFVGLRDQDRQDALAFGRTILTLSVLVMAVAVGIMFVFAPQCVSFVAPGFTGGQRDTCISLFRILSVTQIVFAATWVLGEVLIAEKRWLTYAIAPLMYSAGIIAGTLLLGDAMGIYGAAVGAVAGAFAYLAVRLAGVFRAGFRPWPRFNLRTKGLRQFAVLMLPKMVSQPLESSLIVLYFTALASTLAPGSLTDLTYARKFQTMPELVIGAQFAIAAFPALAAAADLGDRRAFRKVFGTTLATIAVLSTGAAMGLLLLGWLAVRIVLAGGAFDAADLSTTTMLVGVFAISIPLESMVELLARAIYATKNTLIPTLASVAGFIALFITAQDLAPGAGLLAIPAAYAMGMGVKLVILALALAPRMDRIGRPVPVPVWTPPGVRVRLAESQPAGAYAGRGSGRVPKMALGLAVTACLAAGGLYTATQALKGASFGYAPLVTPWARIQPTAELATASPAPSAIAGPTATASANGTPAGTPTPAGPTATPTPPGQYAMDLYQPGDFVGEFKDIWCVPAAMQTMMNIMNAGADTTENTQAKLFDLGNSIAESRNGSPDPEGLSGGLQQLGYGKYQIQTEPTMAAAIKLVVKQIRETNRPAALFVWYGWHTWVVSGFVATADPAQTDSYTVLSLYIEDVWFDRHSTLWNKTRGGYSRPPDSLVPYGELSQDYKKWDQAVYYAGKQNQYVFAVPVK